MQHAKQIAEHATIQSFLNCYLRETGSGEWITEDERMESIFSNTLNRNVVPTYLCCRLSAQNVTLYGEVIYKSATDRHLFGEQFYYQIGETKTVIKADYVTVITFLIKEMSINYGEGTNPAELMLRVICSCQNIEEFTKERAEDTSALYGFHTTFIEAEQSLLFGHLTHPTPKSRQGILDWKSAMYSPELKGECQLHYFRAHKSIVNEKSLLLDSTTTIIKEELSKDEMVNEEFIEKYCKEDEYSLIPIHPLQAEWLLHQPYVQEWINQGVLEYIGPVGKCYMATSSLRTLYHPHSKYMLKFSFPVKVTNSMRINKLKELESGLEGKEMLNTAIGEVRERFPGFDFICDPAFITLNYGTQESGFEVIIRENPFYSEHANDATLIAGLVQDAIPGERTRLSNIIHHIAELENRSCEEVSLEWFRRYVNISLKPMVWMYLQYGVALEAHQQNSVVQLKDGYPVKYYFRDNQGFYFCNSMKEMLNNELSGIGERTGNLYDDYIVDERFRYYLIFNHMFGLINGFGTAGLIKEEILLSELRSVLESFLPYNREPSTFLRELLEEDKLACKANLLTRFFDVDELTNPLEQAIYVQVHNPLVREVAVRS
ncbi:IucA/IucC family siderophore biosynthesis protein [Bacillus toyonensis]|uniref:IucA/IucC family siderophore biosynthesis protein n=1 Tax=Bacillus toyonensis TaxID=155322 RepID=A0ABX6G5W9_9BACI|nr:MULTISPECIES: IucA/IucC family protein [Bacillus]EEL23345.1 Petrobactin biosynthesis protein AsbA [Bacillus cereus Rock1-3]KNH40479.1 IucA/IucC family siderophore biosynthesis protein [Bacillus thuringiensis]KXY11090.1 IucA/IucC family siderophore biosynthesis protein [Bacillus cereus]MDH8704263.1 siderophore synthetase component [Stenotrophomonas sp. 1198]AHA10421.1 Anthrachelin biosynthesis protein AsbA / Siderophore synthetase superfamily, group A-Siderophore synthetase large component, 